jgi:hypothetical protein
MRLEKERLPANRQHFSESRFVQAKPVPLNDQRFELKLPLIRRNEIVRSLNGVESG